MSGIPLRTFTVIALALALSTGAFSQENSGAAAPPHDEALPKLKTARPTGQGGSPLLLDCLAQVECLTHKIVDAGDHAVFFGEVIGGGLGEGDPMLYFNRGYRSLSPLE